MILTKKGDGSLWACLKYHRFNDYPAKVKTSLEKTMYVQEVKFPLFSLPGDHGYLHHRGTYWKRSHRLMYHVYFIPSDLPLKDAITISYAD